MSLAFGFALPHWQAISGGFSPQSLFTGGVQGVLFDISDLSTLFTTSAGTTPATMPGLGSAVSVGLMLDKSQGLVLGPELVTNGDFSGGTTTGWTDISGGILSIDNGRLKITNGVANTGGAYQSISTVAGGLYKIRITCTAGNTVGRLLLGTSVAGTQIYANFNFLGTLDFYFVAQSTTTWITLRTSSFTAGEFVFFDDITVRELPGNHAISFNDTTARPELRARVNLLTYSEEFDNAIWGKAPGVSVSPNTTVAPNGTLTADTIAATSNEITQNVTTITGVVFRHSIYVAKTVGATVYPMMSFNGSATVGQVILNTNTGVAANRSGSSATNISVANVGNYWLLTFDYAPDTVNSSIKIYAAASSNGTSYSPGLTASHVFWGADLRPANIGANVPAYQRIADANTYDTSGFPLYLRFDGVDDSMYTPANLNLSGTDKVAVFAGVRRLIDAMFPMIAELSLVGWDNINGTFGVSGGAGSGRWRMGCRGAAAGAGVPYYDPETYAPPITNVLSSEFNLGGASKATTIVPRVNGVVEQEGGVGTTAGGGNFASQPLFIGSRGNSNLWFNGHLHSLIIAGSAVSAGNISATEQWVAGKTGIQI